MKRSLFADLIVVLTVAMAAISSALAAGPSAPEDKRVIAWGKPIGDVQAGIRCESGKATVPLGQTAKLAIVIRNVGEKPVEVHRYTTPMIIGWRGERHTFELTLRPDNMNESMVEKRRLGPGELLVMGTASVGHVQSERELNLGDRTLRLLPGSYHLGCDDVRSSFWGVLTPKTELATGYLDIEVLAE